MNINSKEVQAKLELHFLEGVANDGMCQFFVDVHNVSKSYGGKILPLNRAITETIQGLGGDFLYQSCDILEFINSLELNNNSNKKFDSDETDTLYFNLMGRIGEKVYNKYNVRELIEMYKDSSIQPSYYSKKDLINYDKLQGFSPIGGTHITNCSSIKVLAMDEYKVFGCFEYGDNNKKEYFNLKVYDSEYFVFGNSRIKFSELMRY